MSQPPPQPPELPPGPPSFPTPPPLPPAGPPPMPPGAPAYLPSPAPRSLASRPIFWILLVVGILAFISFLAAAGFAGYRNVITKVKEKKAKQEALAELEQLRQDSQQSRRRELDEKGTIGTGVDNNMEKMKQLLDKSGKGTDEDAAAARAAATWTQTVSDASKRFAEASAKLDEPSVMDAASLKSKEDIASRRVTVQDFIAANQHLAEVFRNSERNFSAYLRTEGIPQSRVPAITRGFAGSLRVKQPIIQKIRDQDAAYGEIQLKWLDLMEAEWGAWTLENDELTFSRQGANDAHSKLSEDLQKIATVQAEAQRELVELEEKEP